MAALVALAAASAGTTAGSAAPPTTLDRTIVRSGPDTPFDALTYGAGQARRVRDGLASARDGRAARRLTLFRFVHITDPQLADEESPARVEALDPTTDPAPFAAAFRPQETLAPFATDRAFAEVNRFVDESPVSQGDGSQSRLRAAVLTGDIIDNNQRNELDLARTLLEGGTADPNSGATGMAGCPQEPAGGVYTGVQDYDDYVETPDFYDPDQPFGIYAAWPAYPGLADRAQRPFQTAGLAVPSYFVHGNHDRLVQGNAQPTRAFEDVATGCIKSTQTFADPRTAFMTLTPDYLAQALMTSPGNTHLVAPDPRRHFLGAKDFKQVLGAGSQPDDHGFALVDPQENAASNGAASYYSFSPGPGMRFVVTDVTVEAGIPGEGAGGNIDFPQYQWIERELAAARKRDELVMLFGHTTLGTMTATLPDEAAGQCTGQDDGHGHDQNPACDADPRDSQPIKTGQDMIALFKQNPHVIAWVAGHIHENFVEGYKRDKGGGFWEISTASISDFPQQTRLIDVVDNRDGTLSIFGTVIDSSAPAATPAPGPAAGFDTDQLAALHRTFAFNDPQGHLNGRPGGVDSRNVELLLPDPRTGQGAGSGGGGSGGGGQRRDSGRGSLPRPNRAPHHVPGPAPGPRTLRIRGRAKDRGCVTRASRTPGRVAAVRVAIVRRSGGACRFVTRRGRLSQLRACRRPVLLKARARYSRRRRATVFVLRRRARLPAGRYLVRPRARDLVGNVQRGRRGRPARVRSRR